METDMPATTPLSRQHADASPTKAFFVRMLTRDISLDDCILDLIDNSIDSAWQHAGVRPAVFTPGESLKKYRIDIEFDAESFRITDNCGGISLDNAADYAFTFGRKDSVRDDAQEADDPAAADYSVGVYGIGMKRAIFKIGNSITITSHYSKGVTNDSFRVPIRVQEWLSNDTHPWDFDIEPAEALEESGVVIEVRDLNAESKRRFTDPVYQNNLINHVLRRDYLIPLMQGISITVNGRLVRYRPIQLLVGKEFSPMRESFEDGSVTIEIIAGMHATPPDANDPDNTSEYRESGLYESGWYIVCNGRVVLAADRSEATGWGVKDFPRWHPQYTGFVGIALFSAADPSLLPMTTTKRNVDVSSVVYQRALNQMLKPVRAWVNYTNARKSALKSAKNLEDSAKPIEASTVDPNPTVELPKVGASKVKIATVSYQVPLARMKALASALGNINMSYRDVGTSSFEYTYDAHVDDDE
jgi:hypothetical protein